MGTPYWGAAKMSLLPCGNLRVRKQGFDRRNDFGLQLLVRFTSGFSGKPCMRSAHQTFAAHKESGRERIEVYRLRRHLRRTGGVAGYQHRIFDAVIFDERLLPWQVFQLIFLFERQCDDLKLPGLVLSVQFNQERRFVVAIWAPTTGHTH